MNNSNTITRDMLDAMRLKAFERVMERLSDTTKPAPASLIGAASQLMRLHGAFVAQLDREQMPDPEQETRRSALLASLPSFEDEPAEYPMDEEDEG
jgi:hypothetical protein